MTHVFTLRCPHCPRRGCLSRCRGDAVRGKCGWPLRTALEAERGVCDRCASPAEPELDVRGAMYLAEAVVGAAARDARHASPSEATLANTFLTSVRAGETVWGLIVELAAQRAGLTRE